jgi:hypothetical protein
MKGPWTISHDGGPYLSRPGRAALRERRFRVYELALVLGGPALRNKGPVPCDEPRECERGATY